eukprot:9232496-Pyramimonas_sp.AAC.1
MDPQGRSDLCEADGPRASSCRARGYGLGSTIQGLGGKGSDDLWAENHWSGWPSAMRASLEGAGQLTECLGAQLCSACGLKCQPAL